MKILLAQSAGYCFGVKRATTMAFEACDVHSRICSIGPIIHSPQVVKKLEERGVTVINDVDDIDGGVVIIRSHGVTVKELEALVAKELEVVDATCPFVKKAQGDAGMLSREGYAVVIIGEKEHPEVQGILSYARDGKAFVVSSREEAEQLPKLPRIGIVAQTTQSFDNFVQIVEVCLEKARETRIFNTICDATSVRQNEAHDIARQADLVLVIGGLNSANTTRLTTICREIQARTYHVETASDIRREWFAGVETVGVTAGASTPRGIIEQVVAEVERLGK